MKFPSRMGSILFLGTGLQAVPEHERQQSTGLIPWHTMTSGPKREYAFDCTQGHPDLEWSQGQVCTSCWLQSRR